MRPILTTCLLLCAVLALAACNQTIPKGALQLSSESFQLRQLQTRAFETADERELLQAGAAVLQDLGFIIVTCPQEWYHLEC